MYLLVLIPLVPLLVLIAIIFSSVLVKGFSLVLIVIFSFVVLTLRDLFMVLTPIASFSAHCDGRFFLVIEHIDDAFVDSYTKGNVYVTTLFHGLPELSLRITAGRQPQAQ